MLAKIKHVAIVTSNPRRLGEFYETLFGMKGSAGERGGSSRVDGYVWLALNPRAPGRQAGLDHFGFEVENENAVETIRARVHDDYPMVEIARRPHRNFAAFSMHDPVGNVFDVSPTNLQDQTSIYWNLTEDDRHPRHISHLVLRALEPARLAQFYQDVFELQPQPKADDDPNYYLTDGMVTLVLAPWRITDYTGSGIERPALDHIGGQGARAPGPVKAARDVPLRPGPPD
jgi:catechol 2,3-dioxygenase-like lactoylglutathione lyase family enzyme